MKPLMETCPNFEPGWQGNAQENHAAWEAWKYSARNKKGRPREWDRSIWDADTAPCARCGLTEPNHAWENDPQFMTEKGSQLAEFLKHFYGLEPRKP